MSVSKLADLFDIGVDILNTIRDTVTQSILAQTGDVIGESVFGDRAEWWQHVGFASRPPKPTKGKAAAQGIQIKRSDRDAVIASRDTRGQTIYGALGDGETAIYASGANGTSQGRVLIKDDGSVNLYTTQGNSSGGSSILIQASPTGCSIATPWGAFTMDSNGIKIGTTGGAGIQLGADGTVAIIGTTVALNGGGVSVGANASMPAIYGPAGVAGIASTSVKIAI